jgi:hypothetical protein
LLVAFLPKLEMVFKLTVLCGTCPPQNTHLILLGLVGYVGSRGRGNVVQTQDGISKTGNNYLTTQEATNKKRLIIDDLGITNY